MSSESKLKYWDEETKDIQEISARDFDDKLKNLLEMIKKCAEKLETVGNYKLNSFEVALSLKAGVFIITAQGSIKLKYER